MDRARERMPVGERRAGGRRCTPAGGRRLRP